jgi:hypothetical protein
MKKIMCIMCLAMFVCAVGFTAVWAQDKKPEAKQEAAKPLDAKEQVEYSKKVGLFYEVVAYGEAQKDPLVMISAVKLLDDLPFGGIAKPGTDEKNPARYDRVALLDQAKQYAAGDTELLAVIAKVQDPPEKTAVRGHGRGHGGHYGYYDRPQHRRHWGCTWFEHCRHGRCEMVCR